MYRSSRSSSKDLATYLFQILAQSCDVQRRGISRSSHWSSRWCAAARRELALPLFFPAEGQGRARYYGTNPYCPWKRTFYTRCGNEVGNKSNLIWGLLKDYACSRCLHSLSVSASAFNDSTRVARRELLWVCSETIWGEEFAYMYYVFSRTHSPFLNT